jgi:UPF0755 protein
MAARQKRTRRRSNGFLDVANGVLTLIVLGMLVAGGIVFFGISRFYGDGPVTEETAFLVESGNSINTVSNRLAEQGLIENAMIFQAGARLLDKGGDLKPGEFRIAARSSMADILRELTEGQPVQYVVTVPEGFTSWQVMERLNGDTHLTGELTTQPAEGSILPSTYDYVPGATKQSVLDRMQAAMTDAVAEVWANRAADLPISTPEELVILASVIEKETGIATERGVVASVFENRLRQDMPLQSDPTIIYGITGGRGSLGRRLLQSEIDAETPYNTYQIRGLPVGPIANPGIESLRAAANPDDTDYVYFVAAGPVPSDGHLFAVDYDEHLRNVARYRQIIRDAEAAAAAQTEADSNPPANTVAPPENGAGAPANTAQ